MKMIATRRLALGCLLSMVFFLPASLAEESKVTEVPAVPEVPDITAAKDVTDVNDKNFAKVVKKSAEPVLVDFYATWCAPCKEMAPVFDALAKDSNLKGTVKFVRIDMDQSPKVAEKYQIDILPTFALFKNGKIIATKSGIATKEALQSQFSKAL